MHTLAKQIVWLVHCLIKLHFNRVLGVLFALDRQRCKSKFVPEPMSGVNMSNQSLLFPFLFSSLLFSSPLFSSPLLSSPLLFSSLALALALYMSLAMAL